MPTTTYFVLEFDLKWRLGARSAAYLWHVANRFQSRSVLTEVGGRSADLKTVMQIMLLGPYRPKLPDGSYNFGPDAGARMTLRVDGPDAKAAFDALSDLFTAGEKIVQCRNSDCISSAILLEVDRSSIMYACSNGHSWVVNRATGRSSAPPLPVPL